MKPKYPSWEIAYVDAMLEFDSRKATVKGALARDTMNRRLKDLCGVLDADAALEAQRDPG
jgi:hypothetical protein